MSENVAGCRFHSPFFEPQCAMCHQAMIAKGRAGMTYDPKINVDLDVDDFKARKLSPKKVKKIDKRKVEGDD